MGLEIGDDGDTGGASVSSLLLGFRLSGIWSLLDLCSGPVVRSGGSGVHSGVVQWCPGIDKAWHLKRIIRTSLFLVGAVGVVVSCQVAGVLGAGPAQTIDGAVNVEAGTLG